MNVTVQPKEISRVQLGKIALQVLNYLFTQEDICVQAITRILHQTGVHPDHVTLFATRLIQQNSWFERRCEELALVTIIHLLGHSLENKAIVLNAAGSLLSSTEEWESFASGCLKLSRPPKEAKETILEL